MTFDLLKKVDPTQTYRNIQELYHIPWDPLTELIQNSVRAIQDRMDVEETYRRGSIIVKIDIPQKSFSVRDDGIGFTNLDDLGANESSRGEFGTTTSIEESGFGMGLTSVLARSDWFRLLSTNTLKQKMSIEFDDVRKKIQRKALTIPASNMSLPTATTSAPSTTVSVKGSAGFTNLWRTVKRWENAGLDVKQMLHSCLLYHSALGFTDGIWGRAIPNIRYRIEIILPDGTTSNVTWKNIGRADFRLPGHTNVYDFRTTAQTGVLPSRNDAVVWTKKGRITTRGRLGRIRIDTYMVSTIPDAPPGTGKNAIEKLMDLHPGFVNEYYETDRIFISVNGYPQAFVVTRPQERATRAVWGHMICMININVNCVDPGRNKVKDSFVGVIDEAILRSARDIDNMIKGMQDPVHPIALATVLSDAERHIRANPFPYRFERFPPLGMPNLPNDENYVVGLFYACIQAGGIKELQIMKQGASQDAYDLILQNQVVGSNLKRQLRRKIGRHQSKWTNKPINKTTVGEMKTSLVDLLNELKGRTRKNPEHIEYLVCWNIGDMTNHPDWILASSSLKDRIVRSSNYILTCRSNHAVRVEVLVLEGWLQSWEVAANAGTDFPF